MSSHRDRILKQVKAAVAVPSRLPEAPKNTDARVTAGLRTVAVADLNAQFKKELELFTGECHIVKGERGLGNLLAKLLKEGKISSLALDGHPLVERIGSRMARVSPKLKIVDSIKLDLASRRKTVAAAAAGLVMADYGIADTGTLVRLYQPEVSNMTNILPLTIFAILPANRILPNIFKLFKTLNKKQAENMLMITGPSRTADIEKILILGAHGPKRLVVFIIT